MMSNAMCPLLFGVITVFLTTVHSEPFNKKRELRLIPNGFPTTSKRSQQFWDTSGDLQISDFAPRRRRVKRDVLPDEDKILIHGKLRITNGVWHNDLLHSNTSAFVDLEDKMISMLDQILLPSELGECYEYSHIRGFSQGSIEVEFTLVLRSPNTTDNSTDNSTSVINAETLTQAFLEALANTSSNYSVQTNETNFLEVVMESAASIVGQHESSETLTSLLSSYLELTTGGQTSALSLAMSTEVSLIPSSAVSGTASSNLLLEAESSTSLSSTHQLSPSLFLTSAASATDSPTFEHSQIEADSSIQFMMSLSSVDLESSYQRESFMASSSALSSTEVLQTLSETLIDVETASNMIPSTDASIPGTYESSTSQINLQSTPSILEGISSVFTEEVLLHSSGFQTGPDESTESTATSSTISKLVASADLTFLVSTTSDFHFATTEIKVESDSTVPHNDIMSTLQSVSPTNHQYSSSDTNLPSTSSSSSIDGTTVQSSNILPESSTSPSETMSHESSKILSSTETSYIADLYSSSPRIDSLSTSTALYETTGAPSSSEVLPQSSYTLGVQPHKRVAIRYVSRYLGYDTIRISIRITQDSEVLKEP